MTRAPSTCCLLSALVAAAALGCGGVAPESAPEIAPEVLTESSAGIGPFATPAGGEGVMCVVKRMDNELPGYVRELRGKLSDGSHHMIVYTAQDTEEQLTPFPCGSFDGLVDVGAGGVPGLDSRNVPIFIAQQPYVEVAMPEEAGTPVGFHVDAHQMLRIELHWFNTTPEDRDVTGTVEMDTLPEGHPIVESSFAFWGTANIDIPPSSKADTGVLFQRALTDTKGFAMTTHQHKLGTRMRVWQSEDEDVDGKRLLVDGTDWADPPMQMLDPPASFESDGLAYKCEWNNTTARQVGFGEAFGDEMCFLWMYYYPSRGFDLCVHFTEGAKQGVCNHLVR